MLLILALYKKLLLLLLLLLHEFIYIIVPARINCYIGTHQLVLFLLFDLYIIIYVES